MSAVLAAALLAGASAGLLVAVPRAAVVRLHDLSPSERVSAPPGQGLLPGGPVPTSSRGGRPSASPDGRRRVPRRRAAHVLLLSGVALTLGPVLAALVAGGACGVLHWWTRRAVERSSAAERNGAVEACGALAGELRAGRSPADALDAAAAVAVGPFCDALRAAAATARLGGDVAAVLRQGAGPSAVAPVSRALSACWAVCSGTGTGLAAAVERLEEGLRGDRAQRNALDAELASPRATAALLAVLPAAGLLMAAGLGADPVHVLLHTPLGLVCLAVGLGLDALGVVWTQRLVARALRAA